jgi:hypothetical protein
MQHGWVETTVDADSFEVCDLVDDSVYTWHRGWNYVRLDPGVRQGHIFRVERRDLTVRPADHGPRRS